MIMAATNKSFAASGLRIHVLDQHGEPVAGVVLQGSTIPLNTAQVNDAVVDQINRSFVPTVSLIRTGQSLRFPNSDNVRHHVYSFSEIKQFLPHSMPIMKRSTLCG
jgi:hypothetical protein